MKSMNCYAKISEKEHPRNNRLRVLYTRLLLQGNAGNQKHEQLNLDSEQELLVPHLRMVLARALSQNPTLKSQALVQDQAQVQEVRTVCPHLPNLQLIKVLFDTTQNE